MSRKGLTLIELIFSMVIVAIAFSALPKILQLAVKSSTTSLKEEALYNAVAYTGLLKSTAWDEKNTRYNDILLVSNGEAVYECNTTTGYRRGGFVGSRNCQNLQNASALGSDGGDLDDMDDFGGISAQNFNSSRDYNLSVNASYVNDLQLSQSGFGTTAVSGTSNTKYFRVSVHVNTKANALGDTLAELSFHSFNIGQQVINKRAWQ